jgi:ATP-dependent RNA helicase RhlE
MEEKSLSQIERHIGQRLPRVTLPDFDYQQSAPVQAGKPRGGGKSGGGGRQGEGQRSAQKRQGNQSQGRRRRRN